MLGGGVSRRRPGTYIREDVWAKYFVHIAWSAEKFFFCADALDRKGSQKILANYARKLQAYVSFPTQCSMTALLAGHLGYFLFFLLREGERGVRGAGRGGGDRFFIEIPGRGGGAGAGGAEGPGGCLRRSGELFLGGGGVNIKLRATLSTVSKAIGKQMGLYSEPFSKPIGLPTVHGDGPDLLPIS